MSGSNIRTVLLIAAIMNIFKVVTNENLKECFYFTLSLLLTHSCWFNITRFHFHTPSPAYDSTFLTHDPLNAEKQIHIYGWGGSMKVDGGSGGRGGDGADLSNFRNKWSLKSERQRK